MTVPRIPNVPSADDQVSETFIVEPRLIMVSRRSFLAKGAALGGIAVAIAACGNNDAEVFADAGSTTSTAPSINPETPEASIAASSDDQGDAASTADDGAFETSSDGIAGGTFPAGAELTVAFTYAYSTADRQENPYMATWVEDPAGNLVALISLWIQQDMTDDRTERWFSRLRRWSVTGDDTISSATRIAGDHQVAWDGLGTDGNPVPQGEYVLYIESVRRGGTYSITNVPITIGDTPFNSTMEANSEIVSASVEFLV